MSSKLPDLSSVSSLGDIDDILHNQGISDYSWLNVDVDEYRKFEALPRQNLDMIPELTRALVHDDRDPRVPQMIPLKPHVIVNSNPLEHPSPPTRSSIASVDTRLAHYVMAGFDDQTIHNRLTAEFDTGTIRSASDKCKKVLNERGVLGNVYIDSSHFPRCHQDSKQRTFVAKNCKKALFVLQKAQCSNCTMNKGGRCASFNKRIVDQVPYTDQVLSHYLPNLQKEKRLSQEDIKNVKLSSHSDLNEERKKLLKVAFNRTSLISRDAPVSTIRSMPKANYRYATWAEVRGFWKRLSSLPDIEPMPSPIYLTASKKIMLGEISAMSLITSSNTEVRQLSFEHGILGKTYIDGDALGGPNGTLKFLSSSKSSPDFILFRKPYSDDVSLASIVKLKEKTKLVSKRPEIGKETFVSACDRAIREKRVTVDQIKNLASKLNTNPDWISLTAQMNLFIQPKAEKTVNVQSALKGSFYNGERIESSSSPMSYEEVRRSISHLMNTGLEGKKLVLAVTSRYTKDDISQFPEIKNSLALNEGIQGSYFIDPTAYKDFGKGCNDGSKIFRKKGAQHVMAGSSCNGCRSQTAPGWCNKYSKKLIRNVPEEVIRYASEKKHLPVVSNSAPIYNPIEEFELKPELSFESSERKSRSLDISIPSIGIGPV